MAAAALSISFKNLDRFTGVFHSFLVFLFTLILSNRGMDGNEKIPKGMTEKTCRFKKDQCVKWDHNKNRTSQ
jgi:hypothetical protein